jgi:hypothetical protein
MKEHFQQFWANDEFQQATPSKENSESQDAHEEGLVSVHQVLLFYLQRTFRLR